MKGLFIPEITAEMFRNGCLEGIEALMAEGEIYDIDYEPEPHWIPCSERLPEEGQACLVSGRGSILIDTYIGHGNPYNWRWYVKDYEAWMPLPEPYKADMRGEEDGNQR